MATITSENIGLLNEKIIVTVTKEDYYPEYEKGLKEYSRKANIPGFRKGMIPAGVLQKKLGNGFFVEQVFKAVEKEFNNYMDSQTFRIIGQPLPLYSTDKLDINYNNLKEYSISYEIGIEPEINVDFKNANFVRYKISVTDLILQNDIQDLLKRYGKYYEPETVNSEEIYIEFNLTPSDADGKVEEEAVETKQMNVLVSHFKEEYKTKVLGKSLSDEIIINISEAFLAAEEEAIFNELGLEKEAIANPFYKAVINRIVAQEPAELNEEFYNKIFPDAVIKTEEEFKSTLKSEIEKSFEDQSKHQVEDQIYHYILDHVHLDFPNDFIKRLIKLTEKGNEKSEEEFEKYFDNYLISFKYNLLMVKFAKEYNVSIVKQDYINFAKARILNYLGNSSYGNTLNDQMLDKFAEDSLNDKKFMEESYYEIRSKKVFDELDKKIPTTEKDIELEAFREMLHHHHH